MIDLPAGLLAALGTDIDRVIAKRFGVTPLRVWRLRDAAGIPSYARKRRYRRIRLNLPAARARVIALEDEVETAHRLLDAEGVPPGDLPTRLALALARPATPAA